MQLHRTAVSVQIGYPGNVTFIAGVPYIKYTGKDYPFGYGPRGRPPHVHADG